MDSVITLKVSQKYGRNIWREIEVLKNQTLVKLDYTIRNAFGLDTYDHLSEFYINGWPGGGLGEIDPLGKGPGAKIKVEQLISDPTGQLGYVYDFGSEYHLKIIPEQTSDAQEDVHYPRVINQNKPRHKKCSECGKTVATWICYTCSEEKRNSIYLCDDCAEKNHDDHYTDEIVY